MNNNFMATLMQMIGGNMNPQQILQNIVSQNPQTRAMMNQIQQSGMSPQEYLNQYVKQNNIDLNSNPFVQVLRKQGKIK